MPNKVDIRQLRTFYYSQLVIIDDRLELSGQGGWNDDFEFPDKLTDEIDRAFKNVERILNSVGASWDDVIKVRSYHVHNDKVKFDDKIVDYTSKKFREYMPSHAPLWTCVGVPNLGDENMRVEIEVTALMPSK
jgi:enamine deaminase RidA (YjgF/YER057c/UK114 family)